MTLLLQPAMSALRGTEAQLSAAYADATAAADHLSGAREARALELMNKIADAIAHTRRLTVVVEGDMRADEYGDGA